MKKIISLMILLSFLSACGGLSNKSEVKVNHAVFCWLKKPGDIKDRQQIIEVSKTFRGIPGVIDVQVGEVIPSNKDVVESSYDVGIYLSFNSKEDLQSYIDHPVHQKAVKEKLLPVVEKILVYDFKSQ